MRLILVIILTIFGLAFAQSNDHDLAVGVPEYLSIRIVDSSNISAIAPSVEFDFASNINTYLTTLAAGGGDVAPTAVRRFADVQIESKADFFGIYTYTTVVSGFGAGSGLAVGDITVNKGSVSGLTTTPIVSTFRSGVFYSTLAGRWYRVTTVIANSWDLSTTTRLIAVGLGTTTGWESLGFNGEDYVLNINGDEAPGSHQAVVNYLMTSF